MTTQFLPGALFDGFPEPVLLLAGGQVAYENPAAAALFPGTRAGDPVPEELERLLAGAVPPAVVSGELGGRSWTVALQDPGEGVLAVLRPLESVSGSGLERLTVQLRRETAGLAAALQRLDPAEGPADGERLRRYLAAANQGLYRLLRLADHLEFLELTDRQLYQPGPLDLAGFCRELGAQVESVCRSAGLGFTYESEVESLLTTGNERLLRRLLLSLISNAMKAAGKGGRLGLRLTRTRGRALLTVWDSGGGLQESDLSRLFGGGPKSLDPREGLGLGLDAVRRAARLHGGVVMVEGRPEEGLLCVVSLPIRAPEGERTLRTPRADYSGGFSPVLVELSDVLPLELFLPEELM